MRLLPVTHLLAVRPPRRGLAAVLAAAAFLAAAGSSRASTTEFGPAVAANPYAAANGLATMHGDPASSDTTPYAGPSGVLTSHAVPLGAACPTIVVGTDGYPVALCTSILTRDPVVYLLAPGTGLPLASLALPASNVFGGVYAYLDNSNRLVVIDGDNDLLRISHVRDALGRWNLTVTQSVPLGPAFTRACGNPTCDTVVGLAPDWSGLVWFATTNALVGTVNTRTGVTHVVRLGRGEQVANSISTVPGRTAVATDHALYLLTAGRSGIPRVVWRRPYDRGTSRKPGQLSQGTGATPVFFGPGHGDAYVTITDNASPHEHLLVYSVASGQRICLAPVLARSRVSGTEDAPIASGRSVIVTDTYGYPYPATPAGSGPAVPATAPFVGGMTRVDLDPDGHGCTVRWDTLVRSAALPRLSLADDAIETVVASSATSADDTEPVDSYSYAVIDPDTGTVVRTSPLGVGEAFDMLQLTGTTSPAGVLYQGTLTGLVVVTGTTLRTPGTASAAAAATARR